MTTRIRVCADSGKAIRVRGDDPRSPSEDGPSLDRTVQVGQCDDFYVHAGMAIVIEEVQPEPDPEPEQAEQA